MSKRAGMNWTPEEDDELIMEFSGGFQLTAIAERHQRTKNAIVSRLVVLGKLIHVRTGYYRVGDIWASHEDLRG